MFVPNTVLENREAFIGSRRYNIAVKKCNASMWQHMVNNGSVNFFSIVKPNKMNNLLAKMQYR